MKPNHLIAIAVAVLVVIALAFFVTSRNESRRTEASAAAQQSTESNAVAPPKPSRILTKVPDFVAPWNGEASDDGLLKRYSTQYTATEQSITAKTNGISDPKLRETALSDEWNRVEDQTRANWLREAKTNFKQFQSKFFSENADKLFEVGRISPKEPNSDTCYSESRDGFSWVTGKGQERTLALCHADTTFVGGIGLKISVADLDNLLRKFDTNRQTQMEACINDLFAKSGMSRPSAPQGAVEEARASCFPENRKYLSVLAEGNVLDKRIAKVYVMDYETEDVLAELSPSDVVPLKSTGLAWSAPSLMASANGEVLSHKSASSEREHQDSS